MSTAEKLRVFVKNEFSRRTGGARGILQKVLDGVEKRLGATLAAQTVRIDDLAVGVVRLEAMIDRFYAGVMLHLEDVPEDVRPARLKRAAEKRQAWREAVDRMAGTKRAGLPTADDPDAETAQKPPSGGSQRR
jgi:hypothetical protein